MTEFGPEPGSYAPRLRALETRVRLLREIAECLTAELPPEAMIERAIAALAREFPMARAVYSVIGADGRARLLQASAKRAGNESSAGSAELAVVLDYLRMLRAGGPVAVADTTSDPRTEPLRDSCEAWGVRAVLMVPVRHAESLLGVLGLILPVAYRFTLEDQETLQEAAHQMTLLVEAARQQEQRERTERELLETNSRLQTLMHSLDSAIMFQDAAGTIVYANQGFCSFFGGSSPEQFVGLASETRMLDVANLFAEPEQYCVRVHEILAQGKPVSSEELVLRDGRVWERDYRPVALGDKVTGHLFHYRDISRKKQVQNQLAMNERLAALGTLAAGVAHEINNPLAYTIANLESVLKQLDSEAHAPSSDVGRAAVVESLHDALLGSQRVRDVVRDLDSLGRTRQASEVFQVNDVIGVAVRMTRNELRHHARLVLELGSLPEVQGSSGKLCQVFVNLLCNAAQAIPVGRAEENEIKVTSTMDAEGQVSVRVTDTGLGIPYELRSRIFEPFFTSKPVGEGVGLGLAICHQIVSDMQGRMSVESEVGVGTTFELCLPPSPVKREAVSEQRLQIPQLGLRILIVDDDVFVTRSLVRILESEHHVATVTSGREALERVRVEPFDVILCDLMMPNLSGMELFELLGDIDAEIQARMVFVTGGAFSEQAQEFLARTEQPVLRKPFQHDELRATIAKLRARRTKAPEGADSARVSAV